MFDGACGVDLQVQPGISKPRREANMHDELSGERWVEGVKELVVIGGKVQPIPPEVPSSFKIDLSLDSGCEALATWNATVGILVSHTCTYRVIDMGEVSR